jgi:hypothetical protein
MTPFRSKFAGSLKRHVLALGLAAVATVTVAGLAEALRPRHDGPQAAVPPNVAAQMHLVLGSRGAAEFFPPR